MTLIKLSEKTPTDISMQIQKKIGSISFQNFQKLLVENDLVWLDYKFIYTISEKPDKRDFEQILSKNFTRTTT